jgi:hypothetical protein
MVQAIRSMTFPFSSMMTHVLMFYCLFSWIIISIYTNSTSTKFQIWLNAQLSQFKKKTGVQKQRGPAGQFVRDVWEHLLGITRCSALSSTKSSCNGFFPSFILLVSNICLLVLQAHKYSRSIFHFMFVTALSSLLAAFPSVRIRLLTPFPEMIAS